MNFGNGGGSFNSGNFIDLQTGGTRKFAVNSAGNASVTLTSIGATQYAVCHATDGAVLDALGDCSGAPTADYQEMYPTDGSVEAGDVLIASATEFATTTNKGDKVAVLKKANKPYEKALFGIASDPADSGDFNSIGYNIARSSYPYPVALKGRVKVKVTNENGPVGVGDYLTTSAQFPGYAMKATRSGSVIGQALEEFVFATGTATSTISSDKIMVFVETGYRVINNSFVVGDEDGQLIGEVGGGTASTTSAAFLIDQQGTGNILQLQSGGQNRIIFGQIGDVSILASTTIATSTVLTVSNGTTTLFSITAAGHINVGKDTAGTAVVKAGDNQTTVTFDVPYTVVPKISATVQDLPNFFYGVATKTPEGFTIQISAVQDHDISFDWIALAQALDTASESSLNTSIQVVSSPSTGGTISVSSGGSTSSGDSTTPADTSRQVAGESTPPTDSGNVADPVPADTVSEPPTATAPPAEEPPSTADTSTPAPEPVSAEPAPQETVTQ